MKAAFRKTAYFPSRTEMIPEPGGDWDLLRILMCSAWGVQKPFDDHGVWERIRDGETILFDDTLYCVYDEATQPEGHPFDLFAGEVLFLDSDVRG